MGKMLVVVDPDAQTLEIHGPDCPLTQAAFASAEAGTDVSEGNQPPVEQSRQTVRLPVTIEFDKSGNIIGRGGVQ